jgi:hypothetical protein
VNTSFANRAQARYFPITREPFRMSAGLHRLGHDFGNGEVDSSCFQRDELGPRYRQEKERVLHGHPERLCALFDPSSQKLQRAAFGWMIERLGSEHGSEALPTPAGLAQSGDVEPDFSTLSLCIQEDFALLSKDEQGSDRLVLLSVCLPSGWAPEKLLGENFQRIHAPVPLFEDLAKKRKQLVNAMTDRGPYVRFVWSLTADPRLDHHPEYAPRDAWTDEGTGYLRVERQVTVPFRDIGASLFLIRTYVYPTETLPIEQRMILRDAVRNLPAAVRAYKGLSDATDRVLRRLC